MPQSRWVLPVSTFAGLLAVLVAGTLSRPLAAATDDRTEVRALWVQRTSLTSPAAITAMVQSARATGFNTLLVQVRGRGDAYYTSRLEPRAAALANTPASFDPLQAVIAEARKVDLRVHAWVNVNLVSNVGELPVSRDHLVYTHPEWLMVPRSIAGEMAGIDRRSPEYLSRLVRFVRSAAAGEIEGLYASPIQPAAADHTVAVIADLVSRYPVDGVHLDYVRFPNDEFDYSREALALFRADLLTRLDGPERRRYDALPEGDPLVYADAFPERWREFRRSRLTALVMRVKTAINARRPGVLLSAAVVPDPVEAARYRLQDWRTWIDNRLIDVICPMAYTVDPAAFRAQIAAVKRVAGLQPVWAGIGAYRLTSTQTIENIVSARRSGAQGIILFSYDNFAALSGTSDYLTAVGRAAFTP